MICFHRDLRGGEGGAEDGIVAGEPAVTAVVDALVGEIEGREEAHGAPELTPGEGPTALGKGLQAARGEGRQVVLKPLKEWGFQAIGVSKLGGKAHVREVGCGGAIVKGEKSDRRLAGFPEERNALRNRLSA
jgi:hypothetical protein